MSRFRWARAAALQGTGIERILHAYIGPDLNDTIDLILGGFEFRIEKHARPIDPVFEYVHCLAVPTITPDLITIPRMAPIHVTAEMAIRFGMLEGTASSMQGCVSTIHIGYLPDGSGPMAARQKGWRWSQTLARQRRSRRHGFDNCR